MVCLLKLDGRLGVLSLTLQNESQLMKNLHKFYNRIDVPWFQLIWGQYYIRDKLPCFRRVSRGSFWWRDILKLQVHFKGMAMVSVNNGPLCFLWHDLWGDTVCSRAFPELCSYAKNQ